MQELSLTVRKHNIRNLLSLSQLNWVLKQYRQQIKWRTKREQTGNLKIKTLFLKPAWRCHNAGFRINVVTVHASSSPVVCLFVSPVCVCVYKCSPQSNRHRTAAHSDATWILFNFKVSVSLCYRLRADRRLRPKHGTNKKTQANSADTDTITHFKWCCLQILHMIQLKD